MLPFLYSIVFLLTGGVAALAADRSPRLSNLLGAGGAVAGCVLGLYSVLPVLISGEEVSYTLPWGLPMGSFHVGMDALSAFFLLPLFALSGLAAVYGSEYMKAYFGKKPLGPHWLFFNVLIAGMALVVSARDGLLFLISWEVMSLAPFFLVTFEDEKEEVRSAGWTYIIAAHLGAIPLLVLFIMLGDLSGTLDFGGFTQVGQAAPAAAGFFFILALLGFGTKAGFLPLHVWLPEAHPAAPSHVSAVMSGVMIKTGIYGLLRVLTFIGPPPLWWGWTLVGVGLATGLFGILFAHAQHNLKRLLAYSSIENVGVIALGLGLGLVGTTVGSPALAALGYAGALFHVVNHAVFKGLLFLGAGAVLHSAGSLEMDRLGGLHRKMPVTSTAFLVGAAAISGLPPFCGFTGEFLLYLAGIKGGLTGGPAVQLASWAVVVGLALIGGLAAACFAKAYGAVFLGAPRSATGAAHEPGRAMTVPMAALAVCCAAFGLLAPLFAPLSLHAVSIASGLDAEAVVPVIAGGADTLSSVVKASAILILLVSLFAVVRRRLLSGREVRESVTWDCGYAAPTPRMQYTASSFSQPLTAMMQPVLRMKQRLVPPSGLFPGAASFSTGTPGGAKKYLYKPAFGWVSSGLSRFRWIQHGKLNIYVLYIAATLVALLVWKI